MRGLRLERRMTQAECAIHLQTSRSHLSRLESGRLSPSFSMLLRAARAFAVDRVILRIRIPRTPPAKP
jgi:transcriptional regulator with XRE-family HTH domain